MSNIPALDMFLAGLALANCAALAASQLEKGRSKARRQAANTDTLTGLATREALVKHIAAGRTAAAVLKIDIDDFGTIRAQHGAAYAAALLLDFSRELRNVPGVLLAARLQGDTFALLAAADAKSELAALCAAVAAAVSGTFAPHGVASDISVCIGAAFLPAGQSDAETILGAAYIALERAKLSGPGSWQVFDSAVAASAERDNRLRLELRAALGRGEIVPFYQPIVSLETGEICGLEVLARWMHPVFGLLPPAAFLAFAEKQKLCAELSLCLLKHVIRDHAPWPEHLRLAFNAAPSQFRELVAFTRDPARVPGGMIDPRRIDLEITENALIGDMEMARAVTRAMHAGGTRVVLDDFGTGYANFLHLREIPFDHIKIDKSFVLDMLHNPRSEACVQAMLALAKTLTVPVTAEGVEDHETARRLFDMGCTHAQGYLYAAPVPAHAVPGLLQHRYPVLPLPQADGAGAAPCNATGAQSPAAPIAGGQIAGAQAACAEIDAPR